MATNSIFYVTISSITNDGTKATITLSSGQTTLGFDTTRNVSFVGISELTSSYVMSNITLTSFKVPYSYAANHTFNFSANDSAYYVKAPTKTVSLLGPSIPMYAWMRATSTAVGAGLFTPPADTVFTQAFFEVKPKYTFQVNTGYLVSVKASSTTNGKSSVSTTVNLNNGATAGKYRLICAKLNGIFPGCSIVASGGVTGIVDSLDINTSSFYTTANIPTNDTITVTATYVATNLSTTSSLTVDKYTPNTTPIVDGINDVAPALGTNYFPDINTGLSFTDYTNAVIESPYVIQIYADFKIDNTAGTTIWTAQSLPFKISSISALSTCIFVDTRTYDTLLILPNTSFLPLNKIFFIKDRSANANNHPITVCSSGNIIDGYTSGSMSLIQASSCLTLFVGSPNTGGTSQFFIANLYPGGSVIPFNQYSSGRTLHTSGTVSALTNQASLVSFDAGTFTSGTNTLQLPTPSIGYISIAYFNTGTCDLEFTLNSKTIDNYTPSGANSTSPNTWYFALKKPNATSGIVFIGDGYTWYIVGKTTLAGWTLGASSVITTASIPIVPQGAFILNNNFYDKYYALSDGKLEICKSPSTNNSLTGSSISLVVNNAITYFKTTQTYTSIGDRTFYSGQSLGTVTQTIYGSNYYDIKVGGIIYLSTSFAGLPIGYYKIKLIVSKSSASGPTYSSGIPVLLNWYYAARDTTETIEFSLVSTTNVINPPTTTDGPTNFLYFKDSLPTTFAATTICNSSKTITYSGNQSHQCIWFVGCNNHNYPVITYTPLN